MKLLIIIIKFILSIIFFTVTISIAIILFMNIDKWGNIFYKKMDYRVSQKFLGGEVIDIIDNGKYFTRIHKPVFDEIYKSCNKGFIQVDWFSNETLPNHISELLDYNKDGLIDFKIDLYPEKEKINLKKYDDNIINLLDKTSMGLLNQRGYKDGRYSIFTYHNYQEITFLGYNKNELQSIDSIKKIITPEYKENFNEFLNQITNGKQNVSILCEMKRKFTNTEKVKIIFKEELEEKNDDNLIFKLYFRIIDNKKQEELIIFITDYKNLKFKKILPKCTFKNGNSIRVLIKK